MLKKTELQSDRPERKAAEITKMSEEKQTCGDLVDNTRSLCERKTLVGEEK